jgi:hypothetical protein
MDNQLEQRIRDRAYELWMQNGCLPNRAQDYWYQAESEILGKARTGGSAGYDPFVEDAAPGGEGPAPVEVSAAPLGMTSQTTDEVLPQTDEGLLTVPKARKRRSAAPAAEESAAPATSPAASPSKRKRTTRTT